MVSFFIMPELILLVPGPWITRPSSAIYDLDNIRLSSVKGDAGVESEFVLEHILLEGDF